MTPALKLYCAWYCPFAQRTWVGLLRKGIDFEYVEQNAFDKTAEWLALTPRGQVPVMVHSGNVIYESLVCLEYLEDTWPDNGKALLPKDPYQRAKIRMWCEFIGSKVVAKFYALLMKKSAPARTHIKEEVLKALLELQGVMDKEGPFFMGKDLTTVDLALYPFIFRYETVAKRHRQFSVLEDERFEKLKNWFTTVGADDDVKRTNPDVEKIIDVYATYLDIE